MFFNRKEDKREEQLNTGIKFEKCDNVEKKILQEQKMDSFIQI